ncbi:non-ribosomal peptide synthetase [Rhodococcoides yunnanense]|uniref:non-ribosomal peptide synthetase n=1 Tax=Rhodococcoides yunnanense TaxID=278209 RepID=UPI001114803C|nr:non-ribosomal peptide synthetase [Rhodococcus yunnanensis]
MTFTPREVMEETGLNEGSDPNSLKAGAAIGLDAKTTKTDLELYVSEHESSLEFHGSYAAELFSKSQIDTFCDALRATFDWLGSAALDSRLSDLPTVAYRPQSVESHSARELSDHIVSSLRAHEDQRALTSTGGDRWTYGDLETHIAAWQWELAAAGVRPESRVGIMCDRSPELAALILAVILSGAAYIPVDPHYPDERIAFVLRDSRPDVVVTNAEYIGHVRDLVSVPILAAEHPRTSPSNAALELRAVDGSAAVNVLYTSGSTGKPKGVIGTRAALGARVDWAVAQWSVPAADGAWHRSEYDRRIWKTSTSFVDGSTELLAAICAGASIVVPTDAEARDVQRLADLIEEHSITEITLVPSVASALVDMVPEKLTSLRTYVLSGEALSGALASSILEREDVRVINSYGSSEVAGDVSFSILDGSEDANVSIGSAPEGVELIVLDGLLRPVHPGVIGELYVSGVQLARGYNDDQRNTAVRFVAHPYRHGSRVFRTGDLVRAGTDGLLRYVGRSDHQVKIRGMRVEIGEIESVLTSLEVVAGAVVIHDGTSTTGRLDAYVVRESMEVTAQDVRDRARALLPDHMVPNIVFVDVIPLTPNGKVDRKALRLIEVQLPTSRPPETALEQRLAKFFGAGLSGAAIGAEDDFFALGGDSISALAVARAAMRDGLAVTVRDIFEQRTIAKLADNLDRRRPPSRQWDFEPGMLTAQQREILAGAARYWTVVVGLGADTDRSRLETAYDKVVGEQESLRLVVVPDPPRLDLSRESERTLSFGGRGADPLEIRAEHELTLGRTGRTSVASVTEDGSHLVWTIHSAVVDSDSWTLLLTTLRDAYTSGELEHRDRTAYPSWIALQNSLDQGVEVDAAYWSRVAVSSSASAASGVTSTVAGQLSVDLVGDVVAAADAAGISPRGVLSSAFAEVLTGGATRPLMIATSGPVPEEGVEGLRVVDTAGNFTIRYGLAIANTVENPGGGWWRIGLLDATVTAHRLGLEHSGGFASFEKENEQYIYDGEFSYEEIGEPSGWSIEHAMVGGVPDSFHGSPQLVVTVIDRGGRLSVEWELTANHDLTECFTEKWTHALEELCADVMELGKDAEIVEGIEHRIVLPPTPTTHRVRSEAKHGAVVPYTATFSASGELTATMVRTRLRWAAQKWEALRSAVTVKNQLVWLSEITPFATGWVCDVVRDVEDAALQNNSDLAVLNVGDGRGITVDLVRGDSGSSLIVAVHPLVADRRSLDQLGRYLVSGERDGLDFESSFAEAVRALEDVSKSADTTERFEEYAAYLTQYTTERPASVDDSTVVGRATIDWRKLDRQRLLEVTREVVGGAFDSSAIEAEYTAPDAPFGSLTRTFLYDRSDAPQSITEYFDIWKYLSNKSRRTLKKVGSPVLLAELYDGDRMDSGREGLERGYPVIARFRYSGDDVVELAIIGAGGRGQEVLDMWAARLRESAI